MDARHVFVSYAAEDREAARTLSEALVRRGYAVWWDRLITGGALWGQEIERAIAESWAVIVLWSGSSVRSDYVRAEARSAAERHILIPAFIGPCEPPMPFGEYQTLDLTAWDEAHPDALDVVTEALERLRRRPVGTSPHRRRNARSISQAPPFLERSSVTGRSCFSWRRVRRRFCRPSGSRRIG